MWIFGKERQSLVIRKTRTVRAKYADGPGTEQIEIDLLTEAGERLTLQMPVQIAPQLIIELTNAYEAVNPPLSRSRNSAADWAGDFDGN